MNVYDYFQDYKINEIEQLIDMMTHLHDNVNNLVDCNMTRLSGRIESTYEDFLKDRCISEESRGPKEVLTELSKYFGGAIRWHNPGTMINVNPPANMPAIAASAYSMLYNPNFAQDMSTGSLLMTELEVIKIMSDLVGWDWKNAHGVFTFGGKSTNMHAVKIGLQKALKNTIDKAIRQDVFVISSEQGHPCHSEVCAWLGIGQESLVRVPVDGKGVMIIEETERIINEKIQNGGIFAGMILNGGTTIQMTVDPIHDAVAMRNRIAAKNNLDYIPHVHVDSVIGWAWIFFKDYDFDKNELEFGAAALKKIRQLSQKIEQLDQADSFGADFHKTGFCPYISSIFMLNDRKPLFDLGKTKTLEWNDLEYGNYSPFEYTLELSRASTGPISAFVALHGFGKEGFRKLIGNLMETGECFKDSLRKYKEFDIVNDDTEGPVTLFIVKPENSNIEYRNIKLMKKEDAEEIAKYNYYFYLFMLEKQSKHELNFVLDYSSGYDKTPNGTKIGVLKAYHMSPYVTNELMKNYVNEIYKAKCEFDKIKDDYKPYVVPHKPRQFVLR